MWNDHPSLGWIFFILSHLPFFRRKTFFLKDLQTLTSSLLRPISLGLLVVFSWPCARPARCGAGHLWIRVTRKPCVAGWGPCRRNCEKLRSSRCLGPVGRAVFFFCSVVVSDEFGFTKIIFFEILLWKGVSEFFGLGISQAPCLVFWSVGLGKWWQCLKGGSDYGYLSVISWKVIVRCSFNLIQVSKNERYSRPVCPHFTSLPASHFA